MGEPRVNPSRHGENMQNSTLSTLRSGLNRGQGYPKIHIKMHGWKHSYYEEPYVVWGRELRKDLHL